MDKFERVEHRILKHLEQSMDDDITNTTPMARVSLGIRTGVYGRIFEKLITKEYISGVYFKYGSFSEFDFRDTKITLKGLQYLEETLQVKWEAYERKHKRPNPKT